MQKQCTARGPLGGLLSLSLTTKGSWMTQKQCTARGPLGSLLSLSLTTKGSWMTLVWVTKPVVIPDASIPCKRIFLDCFLLCVHYLLTNLITANNCKNFTVQKIHILQFGMQLSCLQSVLCVSHRLLSDVSSPPFVQLYPEIQYVRMCNIKLLQKIRCI